MKLTTTIQGMPWTILNPSGLFGGWPPLVSMATTIGHRTVFTLQYCPDSVSLAHEFHHVLTTNTLRYVFSFTIGRLWGDAYWKNEESAANAYGLAHETDPDFVTLAAQIRALYPASSPTGTYNHPV